MDMKGRDFLKMTAALAAAGVSPSCWLPVKNNLPCTAHRQCPA